MKINPLHAIDFYKVGHIKQYPEGTTEVYSNFTPRSANYAKFSNYSPVDGVIFFGLQYFIIDFLIKSWQENFFSKPWHKIERDYDERIGKSLGIKNVDVSHIKSLHTLGYLPIKIKALPEGSFVPVGVPVLTMVNTLPEFFWLTNYLETVMSCYLWKPITSATTAFEYRKILDHYASLTGSDKSIIPFMAHDFSFRGMSGIEDAAINGAAHLTSFYGTDTVPAIDMLNTYYYCEKNFQQGSFGFSVPATEHSVMCMGMQDGEIETFRRLIDDIYPSGVVSIVSDTWDFWRVVTKYLPALKDNIMNRNGKVVIRPDSGDPVKIICGDMDADPGSPEFKGAIECLWDIFGGTITKTGHKLLDSHIGLIYGDSITLERAEEILHGLHVKKFCSSNVVLGIGSYTYQYATRDNFGFAMKATSGVVNGERRDIFKNPKTDSGTKKSAKGLLRVEKENGKLVLHDQQTEEQEKQGLLKTVFYNGQCFEKTNIYTIRRNIEELL